MDILEREFEHQQILPGEWKLLVGFEELWMIFGSFMLHLCYFSGIYCHCRGFLGWFPSPSDPGSTTLSRPGRFILGPGAAGCGDFQADGSAWEEYGGPYQEARGQVGIYPVSFLCRFNWGRFPALEDNTHQTTDGRWLVTPSQAQLLRRTSAL